MTESDAHSAGLHDTRWHMDCQKCREHIARAERALGVPLVER